MNSKTKALLLIGKARFTAEEAAKELKSSDDDESADAAIEELQFCISACKEAIEAIERYKR